MNRESVNLIKFKANYFDNLKTENVTERTENFPSPQEQIIEDNKQTSPPKSKPLEEEEKKNEVPNPESEKLSKKKEKEKESKERWIRSRRYEWESCFWRT